MSALHEGDAEGICELMLGAIELHEALSATTFDPRHPNARPEMQRLVAQKWIGASTFAAMPSDFRREIGRLVEALLSNPKMIARAAA